MQPVSTSFKQAGRCILQQILNYIVLVVFATILASSAVADSLPTCNATGSLQDYINLDSNGCAIGAFTLSSFGYSGTNTLDASEVSVGLNNTDDTDIGHTPNGPFLELLFTGPWHIGSGAAMDFSISYSISGLIGPFEEIISERVDAIPANYISATARGCDHEYDNLSSTSFGFGLAAGGGGTGCFFETISDGPTSITAAVTTGDSGNFSLLEIRDLYVPQGEGPGLPEPSAALLLLTPVLFTVGMALRGCFRKTS